MGGTWSLLGYSEIEELLRVYGSYLDITGTEFARRIMLPKEENVVGLLIRKQLCPNFRIGASGCR